ncbi:MAG TPA: hypothetical protein VJM08_15960, partial [Anaerolineales bacterium]|nr:hypothetical protein [Anaerolineales bacterium]
MIMMVRIETKLEEQRLTSYGFAQLRGLRLDQAELLLSQTLAFLRTQIATAGALPNTDHHAKHLSNFILQTIIFQSNSQIRSEKSTEREQLVKARNFENFTNGIVTVEKNQRLSFCICFP